MSQATIILGREEGPGQYRYIDSKSTSTLSELYLQLNDLEEGPYIICCFMDGAEKSNSGTMSIYSGANMTLLQAEGEKEQYLTQIYLSHAKANEYGKQMLSYAPE